MSTGVDVFMPIYVGDYLKDTNDLSAEEHGAYLLLLMNLWNRGGKLANDPARLARLAHVENDRWPAVWAVISQFFTVRDGAITQKRLTIELEAAIDRKRSRSAAGRAGADARWAPDSTEPPPDYGPDGNANGKGNATAMANGMANPSQNDALHSSSSSSTTKTPTTSTPPVGGRRASAREVPRLAVVPADYPPADEARDEALQSLFDAVGRGRRQDPSDLSVTDQRENAELAMWCHEKEITADEVETWSNEWWEDAPGRTGKPKGKVGLPTCNQLRRHFQSKLQSESHELGHESEGPYAAYIER